MRFKPYRENVENGSYTPCTPNEATHVYFETPFGVTRRMIPITFGSSAIKGKWWWNGDVDRPTMKPSIKNDFKPHDPLVDHIVITDGRVHYCSDCSHEAAGQTHDLITLEQKLP